MHSLFATFSPLCSTLGFIGLAIWLYLYGRKDGFPFKRHLLFATVATAIAALLQFNFFRTPETTNPIWHEFADFLRGTAWLLLLTHAFRNFSKQNNKDSRFLYQIIHFTYIVTLLLTAIFFSNFLDNSFTTWLKKLPFNLFILGRLTLSISALILIEQLWNNTEQRNKWHVKFLVLGIGLFFIYDILLFSNLLLFNEIIFEIYTARPLIQALAIPMFIISITRVKEKTPLINLSPEFIFKSTLLIVVGIYLLLMALGGYYIKIFGGSLGSALQIIFFSSSIIFGFVILLSGQIRARFKVFIAKHLSTYKYNYRSLWLQFTDRLAQANQDNIEEVVILSLADLFESQGGALWLEENNSYQLKTHAGITYPNSIQFEANHPLIQALDEDKVFNLQAQDPENREILSFIKPLVTTQVLDHFWLIIPLMVQTKTLGFVVLAQARAHISLSWEDYDLVKVAARQAASTLAHIKTAEALSDAQKFKAVNQLTAFLVHDVKTLVSQLSLIVTNAPKHKKNPAFVDDMLKTIEHSAQKMNRILSQLKSAQTLKHETPPLETNENLDTKPANQALSFKKMVSEILLEKNKRMPEVKLATYKPTSCSAFSNAEAQNAELSNISFGINTDKIRSCLGHLIENAQDACEETDSIDLSWGIEQESFYIKVIDTGQGMSDDFIKNQLFKPFLSTKGLSGMGIGAYQSRDYLRSMGGDLLVTSSLGQGTQFTLQIPTSSFAQNTK